MPVKAPLPPWNEHLFWSGIVEDHAVFVIDHLSARETRWAEAAERYRQAFGQLRSQLQALDPTLAVNDERMLAFARNAQSVAHGYYRFEGELQRLRIDNAVDIQLMLMRS